MIDRLIEISVQHRWPMSILGLVLAVVGVLAMSNTPIDAIPDLSETQIIVHTEWLGHGPAEIQEKVTIPLSRQLQGLDGIRTVRGSSDTDFSWIHVIFEDRVSLSAARQRVELRLTVAHKSLPSGARALVAPDAPATGQVFWYTVEGEGHGLAELRALQDNLIRNRLASTPGVAEVASVGGFHVEHEVSIDPLVAATLKLPLENVLNQIEKSSRRSSLEDLEKISIRTSEGKSLPLSQLADIRTRPAVRHGALEKDGNEVVGGVVLIRHGVDPLRVIQRLRVAIDELAMKLPPGVRILTAYDRTGLIRGATSTVATALVEAMLTAGICILVVTRHLRASLVTLLTLPLAVLSAFTVLWVIRWSGWFDVQINMMSLAGITISIGVLVDSSIVMAENVMHRLHDQFGELPVRGDVSKTVIAACRSVGRPIFFSVLIMLLSFLPVFALEGIEGKMFRPLAITKSLAMAAAAVLAVTLVPALCGILIRGRMVSERRSRIVSGVIDVYRPILQFCLERPLSLFLVLAGTVLLGAAAFGDQRIYLMAVAMLIIAIWFAAQSGWSRCLAILFLVMTSLILPKFITPLEREFLTPLDEGTAMDMPITIPGIPIGQGIDDMKARNMLLCHYPEVEMVMGKIGRADTPTDPAPLDMIETMISFRPRDFWPRRRLTESAAYRDLAWMAEQLASRKIIAHSTDETASQAVLKSVGPDVLAQFHAVLREYAYQRNRACINDAAQACLRRLAQEVGRTRDDTQVTSMIASIPPEVVTRFADDWSGDLIPELVSRMTLAVTARSSAKNLSTATALDARSILRLRNLVLTERRAVWKKHVRNLNSELQERAAPTFVFLSLRRLLSEFRIQDSKLNSEVARLREYQRPRIRDARRSHHGILEPAPPDVDPTPAFDALAAEFQRRLSAGLMLHTSSRMEIAGFGGEMDVALNMPGWTNVWTMPIQNRVDMLATGVNTTIGIRITGEKLNDLVSVGDRVAEVVRQIPGAASVVADPIRGKRELAIRLDSVRAAESGLGLENGRLAVRAAQSGIVIAGSGGASINPTIRLRFDSDWRNDPEHVRRLPLWSANSNSVVELGQFTQVIREEIAASLKSENGQSRNYVRLNVRGRDAADFVNEAKAVVAERVTLPAGVSMVWTGEFEQRLRAQQRLMILLPTVLLVIFAVLWWTYHDLADAALMLLAVPGALAGGLVMQWFLDSKLSVTVVVGYIACLGMATSTGIIMLVYLREALDEAGGLNKLSLKELQEAILNGAVCRLRPKLLTEATTILGLAPMLWASGVGAEVIRPMAAPVLGGILVADEMIDLLIPVLFFWIRRERWKRLHRGDSNSSERTHPHSPIREDSSDELVNSTV